MYQLDDPSAQPPRRLVRDLPVEERPLSRLRRLGPQVMTSAELLALALGTPDALDLAVDLLVATGGLRYMSRFTAVELQQVPGVGEALAARLLAVVELGRRATNVVDEERPRVGTPADAALLMMSEMRALTQEHLRVILLDTRNRVIGTPTIYVGSLNTSVVRIAEVFRPAIVSHAAAIIVVHNHPSGDPSPSPEDVNVTRQMVEMGKQLDLDVLDHVVIGDGRYVSLKERGLGFDGR